MLTPFPGSTTSCGLCWSKGWSGALEWGRYHVSVNHTGSWTVTFCPDCGTALLCGQTTMISHSLMYLSLSCRCLETCTLFWRRSALYVTLNSHTNSPPVAIVDLSKVNKTTKTEVVAFSHECSSLHYNHSVSQHLYFQIGVALCQTVSSTSIKFSDWGCTVHSRNLMKVLDTVRHKCNPNPERCWLAQ